MDKLDKIMQKKMNGNLNLKNQQYARQYVNHTQKPVKPFNKVSKHEQKQSKKMNQTPKVNTDQTKNKLFLSQQHLERMLSHDRSDHNNSLFNHHQSMSFLPKQASIDSNMTDNQRFRHFGSLPKIETSHMGLIS